MEGIPGELVPAAEGLIQIVQMEGDAMEEALLKVPEKMRVFVRAIVNSIQSMGIEE